MSSRKRRKLIKEKLDAIPTATLQELYEENLIPEFYHLDDGDDGDVGNYKDGRKGKSSVKRIGGLTVGNSSYWKNLPK
ncbi:MAG: hypothetical protein MK207_11925 [Saprospiraceae bacterium]|nr:hypothetical protein [Saprospiraceae bacterium]